MARFPSRLILSSLLSIICLTNIQSHAQPAGDLFARAAPVESSKQSEILELVPETFKQTVSQGYWFIEHFSPFCTHCRQFAPTWEKLVLEAKTEIPNVVLAVVNCAVHGDLCDENGVKGYPELKLFKAGKLINTFHGVREMSKLKAFLRENVPQEQSPSDSGTSPDSESKPNGDDEPEVTNTPSLNPTGKVLSLDPSTFESTLAQGPMFVKFYAPWCGHCKKLAPTWAQLAKATQNGHVNVAEVNCDDHSKLCQKYNIEGYPTLVYFGNDMKTTEYKSGRKLDQFISFIEKASSPPLRHLKSVDELSTVVHEQDVVYLLLLSSSRSNKVILDAFKDAASSLLGQPPILYSSESDLFNRFGIPGDPSTSWALVALKDHDAQAASVFLSSSLSASEDDTNTLASQIRSPKGELATWLRTHRLPTSLELTQDTFQTIMNAPEEPLVVIAAVPKGLTDRIQKRIGDIVAMWKSRTDGTGRAKPSGGSLGKQWVGSGEKVKTEVREREVVFTWMDTERWKSWMSGMYGVESAEGVTELRDIQVVIADHKVSEFDVSL
ncbi:hypothetical protein AX15_005967 [Amanita polypyramis BW_CC]|nr:hypothetical protein AX15_005967 [Amanita polypyramis BW_CC]